MKGSSRSNPCFLGCLFGFCLAAFPGSSACPKLCACYVPTEVHCTFRYLTTIPTHIPPNVERINLGYNSLVKLNETDFSGLKKLELLMLHSNQIRTIQDRTFSDLHDLQVLKMSYNKVKVVQADTFHGLSGLVRLHMDHNQIEFVNPKAFYGLTSLKLVHLEGNLLKQLHPDTFVTLRYLRIFKTSSIKHIYLSDNVLTSLPQDIFTYMSDLESLYLHGNPWTCDCTLRWFAEWAKEQADVVKCKKDRGPLGILQCPSCASPRNSKDKPLAEMPLSDFNCVKPTIDTNLKLKNITLPDDGDFISVSPRDFVAPIGSMVLNMTDQAGNRANLACNVQTPAKMSPVTLKKINNTTVLEISLSTFLVCSIDYEHIQPLWSILALYSDSLLKLKRNHLLTGVPYISYKYKQTDSENEELFTDIEAELRAEPSWLMQGQVAFQLDRTATTLNTLHIRYLMDAQITLPGAAPKSARQNWAMIVRENSTRTECSVLVGGSVELNCQALGDPTPVIEWVLADGSKVRAPYVSEDGRMMIAKSGKLTLRTADNFDTGVYHCVGTNYNDADVLTFRITVIDPYMEHNHLNGPLLSVFFGETVYLPCQSTGSPEASVDWILPEQMVLHHSSKNKFIFHNSTLKIQQITDRDSGYFKCVTANQYGVDFLVYQVLVKRNSHRLQKLDIQVEDEAAEGSGNEELKDITKLQNLSSTMQTQVTSQTSTEASSISHSTLNKIKNNYKEIHRHKKEKMNKRFRGHKRPFSPSNRRIDPLRWAAFLEKTKSTTLLRKQQNATMKPTVKVLLSSKISGNEEEASGDDIFPEEEFMLLATKRPAVYSLREASGNVVTAELGSISSNYSSLETSVVVTETVTPVGSPMVVHSERPKNQNLYMELKSETERTTLEAYQTLPTPPINMESSTTPSYKLPSTTETLNTSQRLILPGGNNVHLKITPTITQATNITKSSVTFHKSTGKTDLFAQATEKTIGKSNSQVSVVSVPDDVFRHIYSTQKITMPQLPADSTMITHQQLKVANDATTHTPLSRRYGRRRKISGRRRIIRPDRIPNIADHRFAFVRSGFTQKSSTLLPPVEVSIPSLTPPNKSLEQITSEAPISTLFKTHHPEVTTVSQTLAFSSNKLDTAEEYTTSTVIPFYPENPQVVSHKKVKSGTPLQAVTDTNPSFSIKLPIATIHSPRVSMETTSAKASVLSLAINSTLPALGTNPSSVSTGEIPWHNFFGSNHVQKELLEKQPRLQTSEEASTMVSVTPLQTTTPMYRISPVYKAAVLKSEDQTNDLTNRIKPISNDVVVKHDPTPTLSITELPSSSYVSNLATVLRKETDATSIIPLVTPTAIARVEKEVSKLKVFGPGRRRGQRRRRPLKKLTASRKNFIVSKGAVILTKEIMASTLETTKKITESAGPIPTELFSKFTSVDDFTATLQQPVLSTTEIIRDNKSTTTAQLLARNIATENARLPMENLSSETPATMIPLTVSFLGTISPTTVLSRTSLVTLAPVSTKPTQTATVSENESYNSVGWETAQKKQTTKATLPVEIVLSSQTPTNARYPTTQEPSPLVSQTMFMSRATITQTTASPRMGEISWSEPFSKTTERGKNHTANALTTLKSPQSSTQYTPLWRKNKNYIKSWSEKTADQESTTTNLIALNLFHQTRGTKPRIIGGKFAAFTVLANSDAFIPCEASGNPLPTIHWTKVSSGVDAPKHKRGNRLEVLPNGTLSIQNVNIQDRGQYLCVAANQHGSDKLLITLSVVTYPPRILGRRSKIITVHSGKAVTMKCKAEGRPIPTISWVLANKTYMSESSRWNEAVSVLTDGTLIIKKVTVYDRGIYTCTANNAAGSDTVTIRLQVIAAPPIILEEKKQHVVVNMGESLKLPCTAKGNPHPNVHWVLFDGTVVKPLQYINGKLFLFPNGTLYIRNIAPSDGGNYECIATSSTGSERRVVILQVNHRDIIPRIAISSQRLTQLNFGDKLLLNCSAVGEPTPKIIWRLPSKAVVDQWHRMGNRIHVHPNGTLAVEAVTEKDAGDYICVARNKMGDDLILMKVSVTMKPAKIDQKQYFKKLVPYGKDFKVDCKASGSPEPEISWSLPDGTMINNMMQADDSGHRSRRYTLFDNGTLYFNKVGIAEEGDYTCYAQNTLGKDEMKVHITIIAAAPRIKQNSKTYAKVKAGDTALFDCDAIGEPKPKIFWLLPSNDMISASTHRYFLHVNGTLSVAKVRLLDAGEYICVARNSGGDDTKLYKLEVVSKPPLINGLYTNKTVIKTTAIKHSKKQIDCRAEGTPIPQIMWIMPDNIFLTAPYYGSRITVHKNGTLEIRNVRPSDTAEFICVARNDGGESILVVQLEVLEMLRRPMFRNPFNEKIIAKPGKTTLLNCSVDGNPPPQIIWMLPNGTRLSSGFKTVQYFLGSSGTLVIYSPSKADAGKYRCAAKNKVGYIEKLVILEVGQKPTIFIHPKGAIKSIIGESLSLHCLAGGSPKPNIVWTVPSGYVLDHPQINGKYTLLENGTLVVQETTIHDRGSYACKAQNYAGDSTIVVFVMIVAHPPRITNKPPRNIRTMAGVAVQLHCMALGIPNPEITWELPDHSLLSTGSKGRPSGSELLHPQGTLVIQNPKSSDSGTYKCMAKNQLGSDSTVTNVQVI
ncbi:immunoglobulin superfamily member 10 [Elgaria multicarinata webbii]|uniref:immunoglobulin superfamily member 10 n=1 Tax=Elgaria multicarinata webbii TaxID=159646 RepID=UPI002FCCE10F